MTSPSTAHCMYIKTFESWFFLFVWNSFRISDVGYIIQNIVYWSDIFIFHKSFLCEQGLLKIQYCVNFSLVTTKRLDLLQNDVNPAQIIQQPYQRKSNQQQRKTVWMSYFSIITLKRCMTLSKNLNNALTGVVIIKMSSFYFM